MRLKSHIRASIKNNVTGKSHKIGLIKFPFIVSVLTINKAIFLKISTIFD